MQVEIVTTITTKIDLDTFTPDHSVDVDARGLASGLPTDAIYAAVVGGCKATIKTIEEQAPGQAVEVDE